MTSTSVKDVSTVMKTFAVGQGAAKSSGATSFQDIWNQQTDRNAASDSTQARDNKSIDNTRKPERGESLRQKKVDREKVSSGNQEETEDTQSVELDDKKLEEAMAVLNTGVTELLQEIADAFDMSMEELEQLMADMNLDAVDLLDSQKLSALLLEAGGATDSLALLTDEALFGKFQTLMNRQAEMIQEVSSELQLTPEQLVTLAEKGYGLQSVDTPQMMGTEENQEQTPLITVTREDKVTETSGEVTGRTDTLTENAVDKPVLKQQNADSKEQHGDTPKEQDGNLFLQNLKADNVNPQTEQVMARTSPWNETTQNIMNQIMDYMRVQLKSDTSSLEMQLHPASLGTLQVNVASKGGVLTANFVTQNETVKAVLESQMIQLKESFEEQGVKVEAIEVTVQTHQFESNLEQGRGRQQSETQRKDRPRRINLNAALEMDAEEMTMEEQLAAEMMTANGNTVDYTA